MLLTYLSHPCWKKTVYENRNSSKCIDPPRAYCIDPPRTASVSNHIDTHHHARTASICIDPSRSFSLRFYPPRCASIRFDPFWYASIRLDPPNWYASIRHDPSRSTTIRLDPSWSASICLDPSLDPHRTASNRLYICDNRTSTDSTPLINSLNTPCQARSSHVINVKYKSGGAVNSPQLPQLPQIYMESPRVELDVHSGTEHKDDRTNSKLSELIKIIDSTHCNPFNFICTYVTWPI